MKDVKFKTSFSHALDARITKTWPQNWFGEVSDSVAFAGRRAAALEFVGDAKDEAEAWFAAELEKVEAAEKAEAEAAKKAAAKAKKTADEQLV
jgi:hypothetical protein